MFTPRRELPDLAPRGRQWPNQIEFNEAIDNNESWPDFHYWEVDPVTLYGLFFGAILANEFNADECRVQYAKFLVVRGFNIYMPIPNDFGTDQHTYMRALMRAHEDEIRHMIYHPHTQRPIFYQLLLKQEDPAHPSGYRTIFSTTAQDFDFWEDPNNEIENIFFHLAPSDAGYNAEQLLNRNLLERTFAFLGSGTTDMVENIIASILGDIPEHDGPRSNNTLWFLNCSYEGRVGHTTYYNEILVNAEPRLSFISRNIYNNFERLKAQMNR